METVLVNASEIVKSSNIFKALGELFGLNVEDREQLAGDLKNLNKPVLAMVVNWKQADQKWMSLGDLLEGAQQHSDTFYLIWGVEKDYFKD